MTIAKVRALVLTGDGINCEMEMAQGFRLAGAEPVIAHLTDVMAGEVNLHAFHILAFPGGFSFGDHLGSGKALANRVIQSPWWWDLRRFVADGKFVWGVCNGFQALVKLGLLPALRGLGEQDVSLTANVSGRFEDRWVHLGVNPASPCVYTQGLTRLYLPSRHGEGRLVASPEILERLLAQGYVALQYVDAEGRVTERYPDNPNGSPYGIAGLTDRTGRIFGLMPHPEAFLDFTNHPHWTRLKAELRRQGSPVPRHGQGLVLFENVVGHVGRSLQATEPRTPTLAGGR
jgi:phosphoribosylformylglycinamidine synthase